MVDFRKYKDEHVRVEAKSWKGKPYVDARLVVLDPNGLNLPTYTAKGFMLTPALARQVGQAMIQAADEIEANHRLETL
jgi:hypothetical protein